MTKSIPFNLKSCLPYKLVKIRSLSLNPPNEVFAPVVASPRLLTLLLIAMILFTVLLSGRSDLVVLLPRLHISRVSLLCLLEECRRDWIGSTTFCPSYYYILSQSMLMSIYVIVNLWHDMNLTQKYSPRRFRVQCLLQQKGLLPCYLIYHTS